MKTHTFRALKHNRSAPRILTFTPKFMKLLREMHPRALSIFLSVLTQSLSQLGKPFVFDHAQMTDLESATRVLRNASAALQLSVEQHYALSWFTSGIRLLDTDMDQAVGYIDFAVRKILG